MNVYLCIVIVSLTVGAVKWLEVQNHRWVSAILNWFPAILFAYIIPALIVHLTGLKPDAKWLYDTSKNWLIPIAILSVMSVMTFNQLKIVGIKPIILFVFGSMIISVLPVLLILIGAKIDNDFATSMIYKEQWKGILPIVGSWIGGSTSQLILKELVACPEDLFLSMLVLDNIFVNIWTILMFQFIKKTDVINLFFGIKSKVVDLIPDGDKIFEEEHKNWKLTILILLVVVIIIQFLIPSFLAKIITLSLVGLWIGNFIKFWNYGLALKLGGWMIIAIMAILGLKLDFSKVDISYHIVLILLIWILLHFLLMFLLAIFLKVHMAWVAIGSMANLGGISTAPAVTAAYNEEWMPHAIVLAILSMVTGTLWGGFTIFLFQYFVV